MKLNNKGAASILVILIVVVLATFGGIALTASWTNKQLSKKAAQSKVDFYALDSAGEELLAEVDAILNQSAIKAQGYLNAITTVEDEEFLRGEAKLQALYDEDIEILKSSALRSKKIYGLFNRIYFYECALGLERLSKEYGLEVSYSDNYLTAKDFLLPEKLPSAGDMKISFSVSEGQESGEKNLDISIGVVAPEISVVFIDGGAWYKDFVVTKDNGSERFAIYSWRLRNNPIDDEQDNPKFG